MTVHIATNTWQSRSPVSSSVGALSYSSRVNKPPDDNLRQSRTQPQTDYNYCIKMVIK